MTRQPHGLCALVLLLLVAPAWAVNKCTETDGKISFQDAACPGQGEVLGTRPVFSQPSPTASAEVTPGATPDMAPDAASTPDGLAKATEADKRMAIQAAAERGEPVIGMTLEQLQQALGQASQINTGSYKSGSRQQRIYERRGKTWYVYTDGHQVTAVQSSSSGTPVVSCPSSIEIRNAETSAANVRFSAHERMEKQRLVKEMRACGKR